MTAAAKGESVTVEIWDTAGGPEKRPVTQLLCCKASSRKRGVGGYEEIARFEVFYSNKGKDLPT